MFYFCNYVAHRLLCLLARNKRTLWNSSAMRASYFVGVKCLWRETEGLMLHDNIYVLTPYAL